VQQWRLEGGEVPTVKQQREEIAQDAALDAWTDEHKVRPLLREHEIGDGLRLAMPLNRSDRGRLALQLQERRLRARWKAEHGDEPYPLDALNSLLTRK
jgi:hypothetical protein